MHKKVEVGQVMEEKFFKGTFIIFAVKRQLFHRQRIYSFWQQLVERFPSSDLPVGQRSKALNYRVLEKYNMPHIICDTALGFESGMHRRSTNWSK